MTILELLQDSALKTQLEYSEPINLPKDFELIDGRRRPKDWKSARDAVVVG